MRKEYIIQRIENRDAGICWEDVEEANINEYPWQGYRNAPSASAKVVMTAEGFWCRLRACERELRAEIKGGEGNIQEDSCLGFLFNPAPEVSDEYMSFEFNPAGVSRVSIGAEKSGRREIALEIKAKNFLQSDVVFTKEETLWGTDFFISLKELDGFYKGAQYNSGKKMWGNFHKCGILTTHPHYSCWNMIDSGRPDFYKPEYFGELIIF